MKFKEVFALGCVLPAVVHLTTTAHPYLLADNRHITFYLWKDLLRHKSVQFLLIPAYIFSFLGCKFLFRMKLYPMYLVFMAVVFVHCVPQKLLEVRYFILPNLFFQLYGNIRLRSTVFYNIFVSFLMLVVFWKKDVRWESEDEVQMIIW